MKAGWILGVCFLAGMGVSLSADEAKPAELQGAGAPAETATPTQTGKTEVAGKKALEALLRTPAKLDFGERTKVPAEEILEQLRVRHGLSIRFDVPTFVWFLGPESMFSEEEEEETVVSASPPSAPAEQPPTATAPTALPQDAPPPATVEATAPPAEDQSAESHSDSEGMLGGLLKVRINVGTMNLQTTSIGTILNQLLGSTPPASEGMGLPIPATNAMTLDYIVEEDGILITTRMQALTRKETRVYSVKKLKECPPDQLAKLIRKTVRPYSWRAQFDDFGDKLKGVELPTEAVTSLMQAGAAMADLENVTITTAQGGAAPVTPPVVPAASVEDAKGDGKKLEAAGNALANVFVALTHAGLLTVEMLHYGDPPTATIEVLPGKLIVNQSQSAHREIAELLEELARE